jgi:4-amino-4-deoxychorismate lyase
MSPEILINGRPADSISVHDRGLHYGDGLFETLAVKRGQPQLWDWHMERLRAGCDRLRLTPVDPALLLAEAEEVCAGKPRAVLKIVLTRGPAARGYRMEPGSAATRIVSLAAAADYPLHYYREGVIVRLCRTRLACNPALAGIKHLNRLEQVLARAEWDDAEIAEGLMCDAGGHVIEGIMSNIFLIRQGRIATPPVAACGVAGVMRRRIMEWTRHNGLPLEERALSPREVKGADEVFLCNSLIGVWPVRRFEDMIWQPGPLTARIVAAVGGCSLMPEAALSGAA